MADILQDTELTENFDGKERSNNVNQCKYVTHLITMKKQQPEDISYFISP